jgi:ribonuclease P protein component
MRAARLRTARDVQRVRHQGDRRGDRHFVIVAAPNGLGHSRMALSAPVDLGGAVQRNRGRRRARAAIGPLLERMVVPVDLIVTVRPPTLSAPFVDLVRSADALLRAHGLLRRP